MYRAQGAFISECEGVKMVEFSYFYRSVFAVRRAKLIFLIFSKKRTNLNKWTTYCLMTYYSLPMGKVCANSKFWNGRLKVRSLQTFTLKSLDCQENFGYWLWYEGHSVQQIARGQNNFVVPFTIGTFWSFNGKLSFLSGLIPQEKTILKKFYSCDYDILRFWGDCCELTDLSRADLCVYRKKTR